VLGPNINLPIQDEAAVPAFAAAEKAQALAAKVSPRERALIEALSTRYAKDAQGGSVGSRLGRTSLNSRIVTKANVTA
jgi:hypothetical protein